MALGVVTVQKFAHVREADTTLICPSCGEKPSWKGGYECSCGEKYGHWSALKRIVTATHEIIEKVKLTVKDETVQATVLVLKAVEYANRYADATLDEHGLTTNDPTTAQNIKKLLVAVDRLGFVIIIRFNDTYEERICLLTTSLSNRVVLREVIPLNLADISETLRIQMDDVTEKDLNEAQQLVKMLKEADEETFRVSDYRIKGLKEVAEPTAKVLDFQEILAKVQGS